MFDVLKMARPVYISLYFDLIEYFTPKPFIFKNVVFCKTFPKTPLNYCPCKCTNLGENSFQYHQRSQKNEIEKRSLITLNKCIFGSNFIY